MKRSTQFLYWTARVAFLVSFVLPVTHAFMGKDSSYLYGWGAAWVSIDTGPFNIFFWRALSNVLQCVFLFFPKFVVRIGRPLSATVMIGITTLNFIVPFVNQGLLIGYWIWVGSFAMSAIVASIGLDRPQKVVQ